MLLDLRGFRGEVERVERTLGREAFKVEGEDFRVIAPVELSAEIRKDARKVRLVGRLKTTLEVDCGRCLDPFAIPVDTKVDLMFLPESTGAPEGEQEVQDADIGVSFYKDDSIDLGEVIREQFFLALPMKPLCRPDCEGLCPVCGKNRNREQCDCRTEWVDPRMADLKKLLTNNDG
jgi:uncharacterized protein